MRKPFEVVLDEAKNPPSCNKEYEVKYCGFCLTYEDWRGFCS